MLLVKLGFHTCVRAMPHDVWTPMITSDHSLRNKSLRARNKVAHVELLRGLVRPVPRYAMTVIYRNQQRKKQRFSVFRKKKSKAKNKNNNDDFRKVVTSAWIPNALRNIHASKYKRPHNEPNDGCLWKRAKRNSVRASKQLRIVAITETFNQALECKEL